MLSVEEILLKARKEGRRVLLETEAETICRYHGIPLPESCLSTTAEEARRHAEELGFPVVLKVISPDIVHKTEAGGVLIGLRKSDEVTKGFRKIVANAKKYKSDANVLGILVQRMAPAGIEVIVGAFRDVQFGTAVLFGIGGVFVEIFKDVIFSLAPLGNLEASRMVRSIKAYPLLKGYRNMQAADEGAIVDILLKTSEMMATHPEIDQIDLNPVIAVELGATAVDVRILLRA
jgi:acyl-CoA synthetase (NDP forming)